MERTLEAVREAGALCEAAICYTGDILDPGRPKYDLKYYVKLAKELEKRGANLIAIKDMAGLCKPFAAQKLIKALREEVGVPIHFHTHDIGGAQAASILKGAEVGLDIADGAMASMSGLTSQPSLNAIVESLRFTPRDTGVDHRALIEISRYWDEVRDLYAPFESGPRSPAADLYDLEMPGGQYTNLFQQAKALGLAVALARGLPGVRRGQPALRRHRQGDADVEGRRRHGPVPGRQQPDAGRHARPRARAGLSRERGRVLRGPAGPAPRRLPPRAPEPRAQGPARARPSGPEPTCRRPTSTRPARRPRPCSAARPRSRCAQLPALSRGSSPTSPPTSGPTPTPRSCPRSLFFFGPEPGEEIKVEIEAGKTLIVKLLAVGEPHADGKRTVFFELNGQPREVEVVDRSLASAVRETPKADPATPTRSAPRCPAWSSAWPSHRATRCARARSCSRSRP